MPAIWRIWVMFPRAPEPTIMSIGLNRWPCNSSSIAVCTSVGGVGPDAHLLLAPLAVGDDAPAELVLDLVGLLLVLSRMLAFSAGVLTSSIETVRPDCEANR